MIQSGATTQEILSPIPILQDLDFSKKQVIGFLPYWLVSKAQSDYSSYITTLTYFGLTVDVDGSILTHTSPQESEPGWYALDSGKLDSTLSSAKTKGTALSLLVFNGNTDIIDELLNDPVLHAQRLISEVTPIMQKHQFTDLNLDIEDVSYASDSSRLAFGQFVREVKKGMDTNHLGTLTIDVAPDAFILQRLIDIHDLSSVVDYVVVMAYDYHYMGSQVTGPVAPLSGAGTISEYDTVSAIHLARQSLPANKIILGIPLYGYEWETLEEASRSATLPGSGITASTMRIEQLLKDCATCSASFDTEAQEPYLIYTDQETGTVHQFFYPNAASMQAKFDFAKKEKLGGLALWALGYEDSTILNPLKH